MDTRVAIDAAAVIFRKWSIDTLLFLWRRKFGSMEPDSKRILIGSHYFLCDFALYGYTYHPSCCDCFCFCEVGIGVTCLLNATIYKNEFEHNIVLGGQTHKVRRE
jgi:hypothetical protein